MDYNKLTVANLRSLLKERGIASTGLTRKQQIIDRLVAADAAIAAPVPDVQLKSEAINPSAEHKAQWQDIKPGEQVRSEELPATADHVLPHHEIIQLVENTPHPDTNRDVQMEHSSSAASTQPLPIQAPQLVPEESRAPPSQLPIPTQEASQEVTEDISKSTLESIPASLPDSSRPQSEEVSEDRRKRKRRSLTPPVDSQEIANKRLRHGLNGGVHLKEDAISVINDTENSSVEVIQHEGAGTSTAKQELPSPASDGHECPDEATQTRSQGVTRTDDQTQVAKIGTKSLDDDLEDLRHVEVTYQPQLSLESGKEAGNERPAAPRRSATPDTPPRQTQAHRDNRYKDLFASGEPSRNFAQPPPKTFGSEDEERTIEPALHPATAALYVRDFMRPLQPASVKDHLVELAAPPGHSPSRDTLLEFYLDSIRTHCFAVFKSVTAASRVRSALHNRVWPDERTRKPLWADFIPEEKVKEWIEVEQDYNGPRSTGSRRWEVVYEDSGEGIQALLQEVGKENIAGVRHNAQGSSGTGVPNAPSGPRLGTHPRGRGDGRATGDGTRPSGFASKTSSTKESFLALDSLFKSTAAKPKLYFLPVTKTLAERRLAELNGLTRRGYSLSDVGRWDELRRYTFEGDVLVDNGPIRLRGNGPAPRGRGRPGGYGSQAPYPSRGGWRGR